MSGGLSSGARMRLATLQQMADRVQHVHGLVERYATTRDVRQQELLQQPLKRAFGRLKLDLIGVGLDALSQLAGSMEIAAGRSGSVHSKSRILREGVGSLRFQIELEQRQVVSEDEARQRREEEEGEERSGESSGA